MSRFLMVFSVALVVSISLLGLASMARANDSVGRDDAEIFFDSASHGPGACDCACGSCDHGCKDKCDMGCKSKCDMGCKSKCDMGCKSKCDTGCKSKCDTGCKSKCDTGCKSKCSQHTCSSC